MSLVVRPLTPSEVDSRLDQLAKLRITVFRDWPYLYDGTIEYERKYLESYRSSERAIVVGAFDGDRLVGAATGTPLEDHAEEFSEVFRATELSLPDVFYCAESVLLPEYRGRGIGHRFFDEREAHARALGRTHSAFCAVMRPDHHPFKPRDARSLVTFWQSRGYAPRDGLVARFSWRDIGEPAESKKPLQFWLRRL